METQQNNIRQDVRNAALGYLARREHCYKELFTKITAKFSRSQDVVRSDVVEEVLDELVENQLLSDHRFTDIYIRSRLNKGFGPERIALELREKGVDQTIIKEGLNDSEIDWKNAAFTAWKKKFRLSVDQFSALDYSEKARQSNFLRYRGFRHYEIEAIFNERST